MPRVIVIYNPYAGRMRVISTIERVADLWRSRGWEVSLRPTQWAGHAVDLAREAAQDGVDVVVAAGGDGTLGEIANGLAESDTILAPLPVGTANSFARELGLPRPTWFARDRLLEAATYLLEGSVHRVDLGYVAAQNRYWLLWAGVGADGFLVEHIEPRPRWSKRMGKFGYLLQALAVGWRLPKMETAVSIDGQNITGTYLLVLLSNCRRYAGGDLILSPTSKMDDGVLDIWLFSGSGMWRGFKYAWHILRGERENAAGIERLNGRSVAFETSPSVSIQIDGEHGGKTPITCELKPRALRLLVPQTAPQDLFQHPGQPLSSLHPNLA